MTRSSSAFVVFCLAVCFLVEAGSRSVSASQPASAPAPAPVPAASAPAATVPWQPAPLFPDNQVSLQTLSNGVRGIVRTTRNSDLVAIQVWVRSGSRFEQPGESGLAHLVESAALHGTANFPAAETDVGGPTGAIEAMGGSMGSLTSRDATFYSVVVASPYFPSALRVLADVTLRPDLSSGGVEAGKLTLENDAIGIALNPVQTATDVAYQAAYAKSPYRLPSSGNPTNIENLTSAKAGWYHRRLYVGRNISVVVVGDVGADTAFTLISRYFKDASGAPAPQVVIPAEAPLKMQFVSRHTHFGSGAVVIAWRSAAIRDPADVVAMDTLLSLWREGDEANLRHLLMRDGDKGPNTALVNSYDVDFLTQRDQGLFDISLSDPQDADEGVKVVLAEATRVRNSGISASELDRAKEELRRQYLEQSETASGQAGALGFYDMIATYRFGQYYLQRTSRVTAADVQRVARRYLSPDAFVRVEVIPEPTPRPDSGSSPSITAQAPTRSHTVAWTGGAR